MVRAGGAVVEDAGGDAGMGGGVDVEGEEEASPVGAAMPRLVKLLPNRLVKSASVQWNPTAAQMSVYAAWALPQPSKRQRARVKLHKPPRTKSVMLMITYASVLYLVSRIVV